MIKKHAYEIEDYDLDNTRLLQNESLFHNANGYLGVRYVLEEGYPDGMHAISGQYINGFYDFVKMYQAENLYGLTKEKQTILNVMDTQKIKTYIDGEEFSMFTGAVLKSCLRADMDNGITVREVHWCSPNGKELKLTVKRMASFYQLNLFTIEYELIPLNFSGEIVFESMHNGNVTNFADPHDARMASIAEQLLTPVSSYINDDMSFITSRTSHSELEISSCVKNVISNEHSREFLFNDNLAVCRIRTNAENNKPLTLLKYAVFCDSIRFNSCREQVSKDMQKALSVPLKTLYDKQAAYLSDFWSTCDIEIDGDQALTTSLQYSMYQLQQSVSRDDYGNVCPKGLSGEGYEGHYFWDTEMFIEPFFTVTNPDFTKRLIEFRYKTLSHAVDNARILGHFKGALYPWRTIMGRECSGYFPAGSAQYHINADIAYAIISYYLATKDLAFIIEKGAEIILKTARLWMDVGVFCDGRFYINDVTGPDEYTCIVNNNYFTNVMAQYHLSWAVKFYDMLKTSKSFMRMVRRIGLTKIEIKGFLQAAEKMYLPYDQALNINPQDDSFLKKERLDVLEIPNYKFPLLMHYHPLYLYRHQLCKQADTVLAHFVLEDAQPEDVIRSSFAYYEPITTHDSSLSKSVFSIVAARLGQVEKALDYLTDTVDIDFEDKHHNTRDGIHAANMGGSFMSIVYGFGGFRLKEDGISFAPVLPEAWDGFKFKVCFEGSRISVQVTRTDCTFILENGSEKIIKVYGQSYRLESRLTVHRRPVERDSDEIQSHNF